MLQEIPNRDKAGQQYWDSVWTEAEHEVPVAFDPHLITLENYVFRCTSALHRQVFSSLKTNGKKLLEIGCARSVLLPYFANEFGFKVCGIDYSESGCQQARRILSNAGVRGDIVCANFFSPPEAMLDTFDVVISRGVVEHFEDTSACIMALAKFLRPGGIMITGIPNLKGSVGLLLRMLNRPVYEKHVLLDQNQLRTAHENAGLKVDRCHYFLSTNFGVVNLSGLDPGRLSTHIKKFISCNFYRLSKLIWLLESKTVALPATMLFSPYIVCVAQRSQ